jgi:hypothetical protein
MCLGSAARLARKILEAAIQSESELMDLLPPEIAPRRPAAKKPKSKSARAANENNRRRSAHKKGRRISLATLLCLPRDWMPSERARDQRITPTSATRANDHRRRHHAGPENVADASAGASAR